MTNMTTRAKLFIGAMAVAGLATLASGLVHWECKDPVRFLSFLAIAALASRLKAKLPGSNSNMSVNLPFILIGVSILSQGEAVVIAAFSALTQCLPSKGKSFKPEQMLFNVCTLLGAVSAAAFAYHRAAMCPTVVAKSLLIALADLAFLLADTLPVAAVISLTERMKVVEVWHGILHLTFPYFGLSAGVAAITATATHYVGWLTPLLVLPVMGATYLSFKRYFRFPALAITTLAAGSPRVSALRPQSRPSSEAEPRTYS
jgi:hypothetical protein